MKKKIILLLLSLVMIIESVPVFAAGDNEIKGKVFVKYVDAHSMGSNKPQDIDSKFLKNRNNYLEVLEGPVGAKIQYYNWEKEKVPYFIGYTFRNTATLGNVTYKKKPDKGKKTDISYFVYGKLNEIKKIEDTKEVPQDYVIIKFKASQNSKLNIEKEDIIYAVNPKADVLITIKKGKFQFVGKNSKSEEMLIPTPVVTAEKGYNVKYFKDTDDSTTTWAYDNYNKIGKPINENITFHSQVEPNLAKKLEDKIKINPIKVWKKDNIDWKKSIELTEEAKKTDDNLELQNEIKKAKVENLTNNRNSSEDNLPNGKSGKLKLEFSDKSTMIVDNHMLYVADIKYKDALGSGFDKSIIEKLPSNHSKIEIKIGEGVKSGDMEGSKEGTLYSTFYVKPGIGLNEGDFPQVELKEGYKNPITWTPDKKTKTDKNKENETLIFIANSSEKKKGKAKIFYYSANGDRINPSNDESLKVEGINYPQEIEGKDGEIIPINRDNAPKIFGYELLDGEKGISKTDEKFIEGKEDSVVTLTYKKIDDVTISETEGFKKIDFSEDGNSIIENNQTYYVNPRAGVKIVFENNKYIIKGRESSVEIPEVKALDGWELVYKDAPINKWAFDNFEEVNSNITTDLTFTTQVRKIEKKPDQPPVPQPPVPEEPDQPPAPKPEEPEVDPGKKPEVDPGKKPEVNPGKKPEVNPGKKPEVDPGKKPGADSEKKPEVKPQTKPEYKWDDYLINNDDKSYSKRVITHVKAIPSSTEKKVTQIEKPKEEKIKFNLNYISGYKDGTFKPDGSITRAEAATMISKFANFDLSNNKKPNFKDSKDTWSNAAINAMIAQNLMKADKNGNFNADKPITRGEFAMAIEFITKDANITKENSLSDIKGHEFQGAINKAYAKGYIKGYPDGSFKPDAPITRAEAVVILNKINGNTDLLKNKKNPFKDLKENHWAYKEILKAV